MNTVKTGICVLKGQVKKYLKGEWGKWGDIGQKAQRFGYAG